MKNIEKYQKYYLTQLYEDNEILTRWTTNYPRYICLTQANHESFILSYNDQDFIPELNEHLSNETSYSLIYNNPNVKIYIEGK